MLLEIFELLLVIHQGFGTNSIETNFKSSQNIEISFFIKSYAIRTSRVEAAIVYAIEGYLS